MNSESRLTEANHPSFSIQLNNVSKKFGDNWVFRNIQATYEGGKKYAITGPNGSGKSTLLKIIAGIITPNKGEVKYEVPGTGKQPGNQEFDIYKEITFCAPFMELPEELTLAELLAFHQNLRKLSLSSPAFAEELQLDATKEIRHYSSGMRQRLKLALAFYTDSRILLLDEPTAMLDEHWKHWYLKTIEKVSVNRLLIISSNLDSEYAFCDSVLNLPDYANLAKKKWFIILSK